MTTTSKTATSKEFNKLVEAKLRVQLEDRKRTLRQEVLNELSQSVLNESRHLTLSELLASNLPSELLFTIGTQTLETIAESVLSNVAELKAKNARLRERNADLRLQKKVIGYLRTVKAATVSDLSTVAADSKRLSTALRGLLNTGTVKVNTGGNGTRGRAKAKSYELTKN